MFMMSVIGKIITTGIIIGIVWVLNISEDLD